ncbi:hypothetical protein L486_00040 [Kwoniella mangroviensis CBS 10435]|uniref:Uncharacterized protein n=1 Tax=Kwoniella mangroviensis CBS 10435 TaxID=1331196 RepID=A0A1B9IXY9_9TREE|nr:hypothetical protein L486_00040 [Kwoniella mangroviensis CBS 10435]
MEPPLTLIINQISPPSLIPNYLPSTTAISPTSPVPPPPPPRDFHFSPTPNYPTPYGNVSLGSTLDLDVSLENTHVGKDDVLGVRMMLECQGPGGRFRLGEVIHSNLTDVKADDTDEPRRDEEQEQVDKLSILRYGESVSLKIDNEIKDLGVNVLIVSVAWETLEGRKTFQRFLKFNVIPPLSIKTRIQTPSNPNTLLSPTRREQVYLEILIQNVSGESMILSNVFLEPVKGLISNLISEKDQEEQKEQIILLPEDTRQFLFTLSPDPAPIQSEDENGNGKSKSSFPPVYQPGTILPLGRLDVTWLSGIYHLKGRLQTSTLNRRVPIPPAATAQQQHQQRGILPARTLSSQSTIPTHSSPLSTPQKDRLGVNGANANSLLAPSPIKGTLNTRDVREEDQWEFDLTLSDDQREFEAGSRFSIGFRLGVRSTKYIYEGSSRRPFSTSTSVSGTTSKEEIEKQQVDDDVPLSRISSRADQELSPPPSPRIAIQCLTLTPLAPATQQSVGGPQISILSPSRTSTPLSRAPSSNTTLVDRRPFSPLSNTGAGAGAGAGPSRPMTPNSISSQLRQAQSQGLGLASNQGSPRIANRSGDGTPFSSDTNTSNNNQIVIDDEQVAEGQDVFPPSPYILNGAGTQKTDGIVNIGNSMKLLEVKPLGKVIQNIGQLAYLIDDNQDENENETKGKYKWEVEYGFNLDFIAFDQGLFDLGGLRILILNDNSEDNKIDGKVLKEYNSLGGIYIIG